MANDLMRVGLTVRMTFRNNKKWSFMLSGKKRPGDSVLQDLIEIDRTLKESLETIGVKVSERHPQQLHSCLQCGNGFVAKRNTARFCADCRNSYARRKEQPGYVELNRNRARLGMRTTRKYSVKEQPARKKKQAR